MSDALIRTLAITFALHPDMAARLLAEHRDDSSGRCRVCSVGPAGIRQRWPCQIAWYAGRAAALELELHTFGDQIHPRSTWASMPERRGEAQNDQSPMIGPG